MYRLVPKPPKKDFFKWVDQQIQLRYTARFSTPKAEDSNRNFIITLYLNDDSLQIYETKVNNAGFAGGKFLERGVYKNDKQELFHPGNIIVGEDVKINGSWFHITGCD